MGWITNIKETLGRVNVKLPFVRLVGHEKTFGKSPLENNQDEQVRAYKSWVYAAATRIAFSVARAKLRLYKERVTQGEIELEEITEHPFLDTIKDVNPNFNRFELMSLTSLYQDLTGNTYWWMPKGSLGIPVAIWPIPSQWMRVVPSTTEFISGYVMKVPNQAKPVPFPADEIVQFKYPNPADMFYGASPTLAGAHSIDINREIKNWELNFIGNNAQPAGMLQTDKSVSEEQYKRLRDMWNARYRGSANAGKIAILGQGLKYEKTGSNMTDIAITDVNAVVRDEILAMYGVPKSMLGIVEDVNRANAEASNLVFQRETILPRLMLIEEKINEKIMPIYDAGLVVKFDNPVPEDKEFRLREQDAHIKSGYSSIDDERELDDKDRYDLPETESPLIPFNVTPAGTEKEEPEEAPMPNIPPTEEVEEPKKGVKAKGDDIRWDIFDATTKPQERLFEKAMRKFFEEQDSIVASNIAKFKGFSKNPEDDTLEAQILWNMNEQNAKLTAISEPYIRSAFVSGVEMTGKELGIDFTLFEPKIIRALQQRISFFAPEVNRTTAKLLIDAIHKGEGIPDITKRLLEIQDFNDIVRAKRVAQTEVIGATNDGQMQAALTAGMTHKKWLTARDEKVRALHSNAEKQGFIPITEEFNNGLQLPGDRKSSGSRPDNLINCRCSHRTTRR